MQPLALRGELHSAEKHATDTKGQSPNKWFHYGVSATSACEGRGTRPSSIDMNENISEKWADQYKIE